MSERERESERVSWRNHVCKCAVSFTEPQGKCGVLDNDRSLVFADTWLCIMP